MTIMPSRLSLCAVVLLVASALANPGMYPPHSGLALRAMSTSLNPRSPVAEPLEHMETNAERIRRGLPPKKPHFRRAERRAAPSAVAAAAGPSPTGACAPRTGVIHVTTAPLPNDATRPTLDGFLSRTANTFGEYLYTTNRADALTITVNDCDGAPFDITSSNGLSAFRYVGAIRGYTTTSAQLLSGSSNYAYIGGVLQTSPHSTPQTVGNSFSIASGITRESESAIWSFASGSNTVLQAQWVNPDGSIPSTFIAFVPSEKVFVLLGDVPVFEQDFENVSRAIFTFQT